MQFSNNINKFMLLLWKSVYPYEYMDDWEKFTETLSEKEHLYIRVNKGDVTDAIYTPAKRVCKKFEKKMSILLLYHDLYVQSDTLLAFFL